MKSVIVKAIFFTIGFLAVAWYNFTPHSVGVKTISDQVNGTLPTGAFYSSGFGLVDVVIHLLIFCCVIYIGLKIYQNLEEKFHHE